MHKRTIEIAVGIFVLCSFAALFMLAIKVSGLAGVFDAKDGYQISANFSNIGGLKVRSRVSLAGVPIGRVTNIVLDRDDYVARVSMLIDASIDTIPDDSQASILTAGLLGDNYVGLTAGFSDDFLEAGSEIEDGNTNSAVIIEELISKFLSGQASQQ